jgi:hypothetical protein
MYGYTQQVQEYSGTFTVTGRKNTDGSPKTINITTPPKSQVVVYSNAVTAFYLRTVHNYWIRFKLN